MTFQSTPSDGATTLRKDVLKLMVDLDMNGQSGAIGPLAQVLTDRMGKNVSRTNLNMALSGYRITPAYVEYLSCLKTYLDELRYGGPSNREK